MDTNQERLPNTMSEAELAKRLGISRVTIWRLRREGRLPYYRVGRRIRYSEQHVADFLASCERGQGQYLSATGRMDKSLQRFSNE